MNAVRAATLCAVCVGVFSAAAWSQTKEPDELPVGIVVAARKTVDKTVDFRGRVDAIERVDVRARVTGYLNGVLFTEGSTVNVGQPLYRVEKGLFEAAVEQAQGALERSKAAKTLTAIQLQRAQELFDRQAGTAVARDQALAADQQAQGAILQDEAALKTANINLGYTEILSPIAGKIGKTAITKGNVVGPNSGVLVNIVSQDPTYVQFPVSQRDLLRARVSGRTDASGIKCQLRFADGSMYEETGKINFIDVTVQRSTDTVLVRASFPNPKGVLIDGQLAVVVLTIGRPEEQIVVPQSALLADQEGVYLFVVENGKAATRRVQPAQAAGVDTVIEKGLSGGEQVIVDRLQAVRPGMPIRGVPAGNTLGGG
jgi:membrane fusion protein, multidrug efflux system